MARPPRASLKCTFFKDDLNKNSRRVLSLELPTPGARQLRPEQEVLDQSSVTDVRSPCVKTSLSGRLRWARLRQSMDKEGRHQVQ